jgi:hypothetical protein
MKIDYIEPFAGIVMILAIVGWASGTIHWMIAVAFIVSKIEIKIPIR